MGQLVVAEIQSLKTRIAAKRQHQVCSSCLKRANGIPLQGHPGISQSRIVHRSYESNSVMVLLTLKRDASAREPWQRMLFCERFKWHSFTFSFKAVQTMIAPSSVAHNNDAVTMTFGTSNK